MDWECSTYVEEEKCIQGFRGWGDMETSEEEVHFELLGLDYSKPTNRDCEPTKSHDSLSVSLLKYHYTLR